ncbi:MAG: hypothetical protein CVT60_04650 [Actinobacteria bacterium HGW-Actinobacteria-10]|nr:MAG: hypothetical protein CVT60_04650 [Actinobacteria bacterium HGW-Actinobacteria-10]
MRARNRLLVTVAIAALAVALVGCSANESSSEVPVPLSTELVEHPDTNDGDVIDFTGEAIGEVMVRGENAWLHLNDDAYRITDSEENSGLKGYNSGMPVFLNAKLAGKVEVYGDHAHQGDVVTVRGTFNATCVEHGGDTDIHATSIERVTPGRRVAETPASWKITLAAGLSALVLALWQIERRVPPAWERERRPGQYRSVRMRRP